MAPELFAIHEAGHAVVGHAVGLEVKSADIVRIDGRGGIVHFTPPDWTAVEKDPTAPRVIAHDEQHAVMIWAGFLAEVLFLRGTAPFLPPIDLIREAAALLSDFASLLACAARFADRGENELDFLERSRVQALAVLEENWSAVGLIADALLEMTALTGVAVRGMIEWNKSRDVQLNGCTS